MPRWRVPCQGGECHVKVASVMSRWRVPCQGGECHVKVASAMPRGQVSCHGGEYHPGRFADPRYQNKNSEIKNLTNHASLLLRCEVGCRSF